MARGAQSFNTFVGVRTPLALLLLIAALAVPATSGAASITAAPIRTVHAGQGTIGYRSVGRGRPLVMIMGLSGTMDSWPAGFLDALAAHRRVITIDNPGIRSSTLGTAPLTIGRMGNDVASFMRALHLRHADVLGWSLGGMIAQALAAGHPSQVRRLVLAATAPGDGKGTLPSGAALSALTNAGGGGLLGLASFLFPADKGTFLTAYINGFSAFPNAVPAAPAAVIQAQLVASSKWLGGTDPAGLRSARIRMPVLIGEGTQDQLLPVANDRYLAKKLPNAKLHEYADAAHGFFMQHPADVVARVQRFLGK